MLFSSFSTEGERNEFFFLVWLSISLLRARPREGEKTSDSPVGAVELGSRGLGDLPGGGLAALDGAAHGGGLLRVKRWKEGSTDGERNEYLVSKKEERLTLQG